MSKTKHITAAEAFPAPWSLDAMDTYILDKDGHMVAQTRGWGHLTGTGGGLGLPEKQAIAIQHEIGVLLSAAPDMLAALKALNVSMPPANAICHQGICAQADCHHCTRAAAILAAIKKAERTA